MSNNINSYIGVKCIRGKIVSVAPFRVSSQRISTELSCFTIVLAICSLIDTHTHSIFNFSTFVSSDESDEQMRKSQSLFDVHFLIVFIHHTRKSIHEAKWKWNYCTSVGARLSTNGNNKNNIRNQQVSLGKWHSAHTGTHTHTHTHSFAEPNWVIIEQNRIQTQANTVPWLVRLCVHCAARQEPFTQEANGENRQISLCLIWRFPASCAFGHVACAFRCVHRIRLAFLRRNGMEKKRRTWNYPMRCFRKSHLRNRMNAFPPHLFACAWSLRRIHQTISAHTGLQPFIYCAMLCMWPSLDLHGPHRFVFDFFWSRFIYHLLSVLDWHFCAPRKSVHYFWCRFRVFSIISRWIGDWQAHRRRMLVTISGRKKTQNPKIVI